MPVISSINKNIKDKPNSVELFPHSNSVIWTELENKKKIENDQVVKSSDDQIEENNENLINNYEDKKFIISEEDEEKQLINEINKEVESKDEVIIEDNKRANLQINETNSKIKKNINRKGFYSIQLASLTDKKLIDIEWKRQNKINKKLSGEKYNYKKVNLQNGKIFYRLLIGEFSSKEIAKEFCFKVLKKNNCIIRYYD